MEFVRRKAARDLLGGDVLFEIVEWVLKQPELEDFSIKDVGDALPHLTNVSRFIARLVDYKALERTEKERGRPKFRRRTDSLLWDGWRGFASGFDQLGAPPVEEGDQGAPVLRILPKSKQR